MATLYKIKPLTERIQNALNKKLRMVAVDYYNNNLFDLNDEWQPKFLRDNYGIIHCVGTERITAKEYEQQRRTLYSDDTTDLTDPFLLGHDVRDHSVSYMSDKQLGKILTSEHPDWIDIRHTGGTYDETAPYKFVFSKIEPNINKEDTSGMTKSQLLDEKKIKTDRLIEIRSNSHKTTEDYNYIAQLENDIMDIDDRLENCTGASTPGASKSRCIVSGGKSRRNGRKSRSSKSRSGRKSRRNRRKSRR